MKKIITSCLFSIGLLGAYAQSPAPEMDSVRNPINQNDPELKNLPANPHYIDEMQRIAAAELPAPVLDSLKKLEPASWEKSVVYRDKVKSVYVVEIRAAGEEKSYRFSKDGKRLKNSDAKKNY
jgi:hypothetical protein